MLSVKAKRSLSSPVNAVEIDTALAHIEDNKAAGVDVYNALFFLRKLGT